MVESKLLQFLWLKNAIELNLIKIIYGILAFLCVCSPRFLIFTLAFFKYLWCWMQFLLIVSKMQFHFHFHFLPCAVSAESYFQTYKYLAFVSNEWKLKFQSIIRIVYRQFHIISTPRACISMHATQMFRWILSAICDAGDTLVLAIIIGSLTKLISFNPEYYVADVVWTKGRARAMHFVC